MLIQKIHQWVPLGPLEEYCVILLTCTVTGKYSSVYFMTSVRDIL